MTPAEFFNLLPVLLGLFAGQPGGVDRVARLVVQDEVILRVPVQPRPFAGRVEWVEKKGAKCIPADAIRSAVLSGPQQVDFILVGRDRLRAKFDEDCPALDFYGGFYLQPEDELICAGRDAIHSRVGGSCRIKRFRHLEPRLRR